MKFTLAACALSLLFAGAAVAQNVEGHLINYDTIYCRSCPRTNCKSQREYKRGDIVTLTCNTNVNSENLNGDAWWVKTTDGCYISDKTIDYVNGLPSKDC